MTVEAWRAYAEYADGTEVDVFIPYTANGNYSRECEEQYNIESWLIERNKECTFYSVGYYGEVDIDELYRGRV